MLAYHVSGFMFHLPETTRRALCGGGRAILSSVVHSTKILDNQTVSGDAADTID